ncbi:unnamed protein product [Schistosoma rodhaini]|nr:unnamed protein product [Schistosoma rodhaini]
MSDEMDVRIKYPFKHFLKEGIVSKPMKKRAEVNNDSPTNIEDDTIGPKNDENDLMISSDSQIKNRKQPRIMKGRSTVNRHPDSNKNLVEKHCFGVQPGLSKTEITTELIRYAQMVNKIQETNPKLFLRKCQ